MKIAIKLFMFLFLPLSGNAVDINKSDWVNNMSTALPSVFCSSRQYFRQCYDVTSQECQSTTISVTEICINNNIRNIPDVIIQPKDSTYWGTIIGQCAGKAYQLTLVSKRINSEKCNNSKNW
ncbi:hypothetical protein MNBD_GAMMA09-2529 [hydrothermal vent metagenome]|uniref:T2SS substrate NttA domain-containing protein n=1 Tax=hydrothermal vent metagenome TaxID=652676 RepID=A0A3B0YKX6_9ZZZZ